MWSTDFLGRRIFFFFMRFDYRVVYSTDTSPRAEFGMKIECYSVHLLRCAVRGRVAWSPFSASSVFSGVRRLSVLSSDEILLGSFYASEELRVMSIIIY